MFTSVHRSVLFGPSSGEGPREVRDTVFFPRPVTAALAGLAGFSASFSGSADGRPFGRLVVDVGAAEFTGKEAQVACRFGLRDWSGEWDDAYGGVVEYVLRVELEDDESVGAEVTINGVEYSQSIQFFRSRLDLDADTRREDNTIPLIAGKPTAIRVYADYNPPSGAIDIQDVYQGELEVESSGQTTVLTELNGWGDSNVGSSLRPDRDTAEMPIEKHRAPFFTLPSELSTGKVTIRGRLRVRNEDTGAESSWSPFFERRLRFHAAKELKVFLVGLQIAAGNQPAVRAPTQEEAELLLEASRSMFPYRGIAVSGFDVKEIASASAEPIRRLLVDMMGDVRDEYFLGLTSADYEGVISGAEGDAAAGIAWLEDGVATSLADPNVVAHELGHLKTLEHVHVTNEDDPYDVLPSYGSYFYGSIGQHGVDTATHVVQEPQGTADIMSYARPQWISAHNYSRLLDIGEHIERPPRFAETLFLSATISRDRSLVRHPSFHFPATVRSPRGGHHAFVAELADECRHPLAWSPLTPSPGPSYVWPKTFYASVPYPPGARWLMIWEEDRLLHEECIPPPPRLDLTCTASSAGVHLSWDGEPAGLWYLVHWQDRDGNWRGLDQRTQDTTALVPAALFDEQAAVRLLATSGVATASAVCTQALPRRLRELTITVAPLHSPPTNATLGWRAFVYDAAGRSVSSDDLRWYDPAGRQIGKGATLPIGVVDSDEVTLTIRDRLVGPGLAHRTWRVRGVGADRTLEETG